MINEEKLAETLTKVLTEQAEHEYKLSKLNEATHEALDVCKQALETLKDLMRRIEILELRLDIEEPKE